MSEWISVKDRLPEFEQDILICRDLGEARIVQTEEYQGSLYWGTSYNNVTHWMPLPEPPEVKP